MDGAEFQDGVLECLGGLGDILVGGVSGEAEAEAGFGGGFGDAHGELDVGWGLLPAHAGGSGGAGDVGLIEEDEEASGIAVGEREVGGVGEAFGGMTVAGDAGNGGEKKVFPFVPEGGELFGALVSEEREGEFSGGPHTDDACGVFRAAAVSVFLTAAVEEGVEIQAASYVERADAFGAVEFMGGQG